MVLNLTFISSNGLDRDRKFSMKKINRISENMHCTKKNHNNMSFRIQQV